MLPKPDPYKSRTGKTLDEFRKQRPTAEQSSARRFKQQRSGYEIKTLGKTSDGNEVLISEEEREANVHIIGQPRQGKSKFIEDSIRRDIDAGNGVCLLDPGQNGDTVKKVLRYCAYRGIKKVVYIDPQTMWRGKEPTGKLPTLKMLKDPPYREHSVNMVINSVNALFGVTNPLDTNRVHRYLEALLTALAKQNFTLYETKDFYKYQKPSELPFLLDDSDDDSEIVREAFRTASFFQQHFISTVGRLNTFRKEPLSLMVGADTGIDFVKMIREGWVILVNLSVHHAFTDVQSRLLGIFIISELMHAIDVLFRSHPEGVMKHVFYLYIDEAAKFASPQLKHILNYMGKTGLRLIVAHHEFDQFRKNGQEDVLSAIKNGCRIKLMFNMSNYDDRLEMIKDLGYGGKIPPLLASYANRNIPKQQAVLTKDKEDPVRIKVRDVPEITRQMVSDDELQDYIDSLLEQPWYLTRDEIISQTKSRHNAEPRKKKSNNKTAANRAKANSKTGSSSGVSDTEDLFGKWKDIS